MTTAAYDRAVTPRSSLTRWLARLARVPLSFHQLLFRLAVASVFLPAGLIKAFSWEATVALFRDEYHVPVFSPDVVAGLATCFELGCSTLLILGLATIPLSMHHLDGHNMILLGDWAQRIVTFQDGAAAQIIGVHWIFKLHIFLGLTMFLAFPFSRLVHIWSAPVWYVGRRYQVVRRAGNGAARQGAGR